MCLEADGPSSFAEPHCCNPSACPDRYQGNTPDHTWAKGKKRQLPLPATVNTAAQEKDRKKTPRNHVQEPTREAHSVSERQEINSSRWSKTSRVREQRPNSPRASRPTVHLKTQTGTYSGAGQVAQQVKMPASNLNDPTSISRAHKNQMRGPTPNSSKLSSDLHTPAPHPTSTPHRSK